MKAQAGAGLTEKKKGSEKKREKGEKITPADKERVKDLAIKVFC
jgi:hypothetical protein